MRTEHDCRAAAVDVHARLGPACRCHSGKRKVVKAHLCMSCLSLEERASGDVGCYVGACARSKTAQ